MSKPKTGEQTGQQSTAAASLIWGGFGAVSLDRMHPATYHEYRCMRRDPTIALARWLIAAPIIAAGWQFVAEDDAPENALDFVKKVMEPMQLHILRTTAYGCCDFGWQGFEMVKELTKDKMIGFKKAKPLLHDITDIVVDSQNGSFQGYRNAGVTLDVDDCLHFCFEPEGTDWYGWPMLENVRLPHKRWLVIEESAGRFDAKVAGEHLLIHYPIGVTPNYEGRTNVDNSIVAADIIARWQSSGALAIPEDQNDWIDNANREAPPGWRIELLSGSSGGGAFTERLNYQDKMKVRGLGLPERAVIEGEYGTKADAQAHGDFAILNLELRGQDWANTVSWHCVDKLMRWNWGEEHVGKIKCKANPISDANKAFLRDVYKTLMTNPDAVVAELENMDRDALRDTVGVPTLPKSEVPDEPHQIPKIEAPELKKIESVDLPASSAV
jgi:hypothetical protein